MIKRPMRPMCAAAIALLAALPAMAQPIERAISTARLGQPQAGRGGTLDRSSPPSAIRACRRQPARGLGPLIDPVRAMIESGDENQIVNGLMIAGSIVTPEAIGLIERASETQVGVLRRDAGAPHNAPHSGRAADPIAGQRKWRVRSKPPAILRPRRLRRRGRARMAGPRWATTASPPRPKPRSPSSHRAPRPA